MMVSIDEVRKIFERTLSEFVLLQENKTSLVIDADYYWIISPEQVHDMQGKPNDFQVGSYHDEIEELRALLSNDSSIGSNGLRYLAGILAYMSEV